MADTKVSALSEVSAPALADELYWVEDPGGTPTSRFITVARMMGLLRGFAPMGRLTLETGVPISTTDQLAKSTLYFTPYLGNLVWLWDGTRWKMYVFTERSLALTLTSGKNYDVFLYDNAGTLTLALSADWTNDTTRADALGTQDGVAVLNSDKTKLHVGTIRASATDQTADSGGNAGTTQVGATRFVWNAYNQVRRNLKIVDKTDGWTYGTQALRQANGASGNRVEYVTGDAATLVSARADGIAVLGGNGSQYALAGVGVDSTTVFSGKLSPIYNASVGLVIGGTFGTYAGAPGLGYHAINWLEGGADATCSFKGDDGGALMQSGLTAEIVM